MLYYKKIIFLKIILFLLATCNLYAQDSTSSSKQHLIGIGSGVMGYYGDYGRKNFQSFRYNTYNYNAHLKYQYLFMKGLSVDGSLYKSKANVEETGVFNGLIIQNNFLADLMGGDASISYILPLTKKPDPLIKPFISAGAGYLTYNSFEDKKDKDGILYNYWSEGSIRDKSETEEGASEAKILQRDYDYETKLKSGTAFFVPIKLGVELSISNRFTFDVGSVIHYTFTDEIDNATDGKNDWYAYSSVTIKYNLSYKKPPEQEEEGFEHIILTENDCKDHDNDGVISFYDKCPNTPKETVINEFGCPMDDDFDGIPNYKDKQNPSRSMVTIDLDGIEITQGKKVEIVERQRNEGGFIIRHQQKEKKLLIPNITDSDSVSISNLNSGKVVKVNSFNSSEVYEVPEILNYDKLLIHNYSKNDVYVVPIYYDNKYIKKAPTKEKGKEYDLNGEKEVITYRVQIISTKNPVDVNSPKFGGLDPATISSYTDLDGLIKYYTGDFNDSKTAIQKEKELRKKGLKDAFVIVFVNGQRVKGKRAEELMPRK